MKEDFEFKKLTTGSSNMKGVNMNTALLALALIAIVGWYFTRPTENKEVEACTQADSNYKGLSASLEQKFTNWNTNLETKLNEVSQSVQGSVSGMVSKFDKDLAQLRDQITTTDQKRHHQLDAIELEIKRIKEREAEFQKERNSTIQQLALLFPKGVPIYWANKKTKPADVPPEVPKKAKK